MGVNYQLHGYTAHYVSGRRKLSRTLKILRAVVREIEAGHGSVDSVSLNHDGEWGWTATVLYL